jgi:hypothetical protein
MNTFNFASHESDHPPFSDSQITFYAKEETGNGAAGTAFAV